MAAEYSDDESVSGSDSGDEIEAALKAVPVAVVPVKTKRVYTRKAPLSDEQKSAIVSKLQKARAAKAGNYNKKKQADAQEAAELKELKKLKAEGKLKIKKERPAEVSIPKKAVKETKATEVHHHYYGAEPADEPKKARVKKTEVPEPPATPRAKPAKMTFA
jgi:hypothetical protein